MCQKPSGANLPRRLEPERIPHSILTRLVPVSLLMEQRAPLEKADSVIVIAIGSDFGASTHLITKYAFSLLHSQMGHMQQLLTNWVVYTLRWSGPPLPASEQLGGWKTWTAVQLLAGNVGPAQTQYLSSPEEGGFLLKLPLRGYPVHPCSSHNLPW